MPLARWLALVLVSLSGCSRPVYPIDRLVIVELAPDLVAHAVGYTSVGVLATDGVHAWNGLGAHVKMLDELTADDDTSSARVLRIHDGRLPAGEYGWYDWESAQITIDAGKLGWGDPPLFIAALFAHEVGHAIGLDHVVAQPAIMFHVADPVYGPSQADYAEFYRVWPP